MKVRFLLSFLLLYLVTFPTTSRAHVLKTDKTIGVVVHIEPDDDPYVGIPSSIIFEFKDKKNTFNLTECNCTLDILANNKTLSTLHLSQESTNLTSSITYTFPEKNVYTLLIKGTPQKENSFKPFTISYDVRVERENIVNEQPIDSQTVVLGLFLGSIFILGITFLVKKFTHEKGGVKHEENT